MHFEYINAFNSINYFTKHSGIRLHIGEMGGRFYKACIKIQFTDDLTDMFLLVLTKFSCYLISKACHTNTNRSS